MIIVIMIVIMGAAGVRRFNEGTRRNSDGKHGGALDAFFGLMEFSRVADTIRRAIRAVAFLSTRSP